MYKIGYSPLGILTNSYDNIFVEYFLYVTQN